MKAVFPVLALIVGALSCSTQSNPPEGASAAGSTMQSGGASGATGAVGGSSPVGGTGGEPTGGTGGTPSGGGSSGSGGMSGGPAATGGATDPGGTGGALAGGAGQAGSSVGGVAGAPPVTGGAAGSGGADAGGMGGGAGASGGPGDEHWVGTWATGPQLTEPENNPPSPGLANNTLRQVFRVSIGGDRLRLRVSNEYGDGPVTLSSVHIAKSTGMGNIDVATDRALAFAGAASVTIPVGQSVWSDASDFPLAPLSSVAVTIRFGAVPGGITGHPGSRTTSFIQGGDAVSSPTVTGASTDHWYYVTGLDVMADAETAALVVLGDSITDGRGSTTNMNNRWPDLLAVRLQANDATKKVGVLNLGIGGNNVLSGGLGPPAQERFDSQVLGQSGVRWLIVLAGVNDIGDSTDASVVTALTGAFQTFVTKARAANVKAYGSPILPFGGSMYDTGDHEMSRQTVNDWIRAAGNFDAVVDLDAAVRDAENPRNLTSAYDSGDMLHLTPAGYQKMADAVDLSLFMP
jgi:lysophospholipase L1-like esterase